MSRSHVRTVYPPILARTLLYETLRDGTKHLLDWHLVNTSLGLMVEPRCLTRQTGNMQNSDPYEAGYTDMLEIDEGLLFSTFNFGGSQWPRNLNTQ